MIDLNNTGFLSLTDFDNFCHENYLSLNADDLCIIMNKLQTLDITGPTMLGGNLAPKCDPERVEAILSPPGYGFRQLILDKSKLMMFLLLS